MFGMLLGRLVQALLGMAPWLPPQLLTLRPHTPQAGGRITAVIMWDQITLSIRIGFTANKLTAIHAELLVELANRLPLVGLRTSTPLAVLADRLLPVGRLTTTPLVALVSPRLHRSTPRPRSVRPSLQLRLTQLRLAQVTAQRHRSIQRLRLVRHTERVTARLQRLIPTLRAPLVMQLALADQRPRAAIHQP